MNQTGYDVDTAAKWDAMRQSLAGATVVELTLRDCAVAVGLRWPYLCGDKPMKFFLAMDWISLKNLRGFGRHKTSELLQIVRKLTREDSGELSEQTPAVEEDRPEISLSKGLAEFGIAPETPTDLLFLSSRARKLLLRAGKLTVGTLLEYLAATDAKTLRLREGVGRHTVSELYGLLTAVTGIRADRVRIFLPLRANGYGLCFSSFVKHLLAQEDPRYWDAFYAYFVEKTTLRVAAQRISRTRQRIRQLVSAFMRKIDRSLGYFPDERYTFWDAWQRCESLDLYFEDDLSGAAKSVVAGALDRVFASSLEGKAILKHRRRIFDVWWKEVRDLPAFYFGGLSVAKFVRDKGEPQFLQSFLGYLKRKPGVEVSKTMGKAFSSRCPLRRVIRAVVVSSNGTVNAGAILERLRSEGLCQDMEAKTLSRKLHRWVERGDIPADRVECSEF